MPTYDFQCKDCGATFSLTTSWARKKEAECPECHGQNLKEVFGNYRVGFGGPNAPSGGAGCGSVG